MAFKNLPRRREERKGLAASAAISGTKAREHVPSVHKYGNAIDSVNKI